MCGIKFDSNIQICPICKTENSIISTNCSNCSNRLQLEVNTQEDHILSSGDVSKFAQYIPKQLLQKLTSSKSSKMQNERKIVTILFCDVQGSTAAAETMDPEEWAEIMNEAFKYLIQPVYKYEGVIARLMGDAILAFFGAPIAHEDDPQRAVLAALDILESIKPFKIAINNKWKINFNVRVGINTGLVVVGEVGSDLRVEYTAMGDAVNLASRMESTAEPGTIQITEATFRLVSTLFEIIELGPMIIKGKAEPVCTYRVLSIKAEKTQNRINSPLIGRKKEFKILQNATKKVLENKFYYI